MTKGTKQYDAWYTYNAQVFENLPYTLNASPIYPKYTKPFRQHAHQIGIVLLTGQAMKENFNQSLKVKLARRRIHSGYFQAFCMHTRIPS